LSSRKNKLFESAQKNIQKGQYGRAAEEYAELIALDPGDIRHRQKYAEILAKVNRKSDAVREYTALAKHYIDSVHYLKAIAVYKQIQKLEPTNADISLTLASLNEKQNLIGNAIAEYNSALRIYEENSENRKALNVLQSLLALDASNTAIRLRVAEKHFVIGEESSSCEAFVSLAEDLRSKGDELGYEQVFSRLSALFPEKAEMLRLAKEEPPAKAEEPASVQVAPPCESTVEPHPPTDLSVLPESEVTPAAEEVPGEEEIEELEEIEALDLLEEELELVEEETHPHDWEEEIDLGDLGSQTVDFSTAASESQMELEPPPAVEIDLGELPELDLEELQLELEPLEMELELEEIAEPGSAVEVAAGEEPLPSAAEVLGETFNLAGELAKFADELDFGLLQNESAPPSGALTAEMFKTSDLDREDAESHYSLGLAYKEMGLFEEAIAEFEVSSASTARRVDSLLLKGICHRDCGDLDLAMEILGALLDGEDIGEDEMVSIKYELAICHEMKEDMDSARRLFAEVVALCPRFGDAAARLGKL